MVGVLVDVVVVTGVDCNLYVVYLRWKYGKIWVRELKGFTDVVERDVGWKDAVGKIWDDGVGVIRGFWNPC